MLVYYQCLGDIAFQHQGCAVRIDELGYLAKHCVFHQCAVKHTLEFICFVTIGVTDKKWGVYFQKLPQF